MLEMWVTGAPLSGLPDDGWQVIWCLYHAHETLRRCCFFYDIGLNQGQLKSSMAPLPKSGDVGMWRDVVCGSAAGEGGVVGSGGSASGGWSAHL